VERLRHIAMTSFRAKEQELEKQLRDTEEKLTALQSHRNDKSAMILSPSRRKELDNFQDEKLRIRKELRAVRAGLDKDIKGLGNELKIVNIIVYRLSLRWSPCSSVVAQTAASSRCDALEPESQGGAAMTARRHHPPDRRRAGDRAACAVVKAASRARHTGWRPHCGRVGEKRAQFHRRSAFEQGRRTRTTLKKGATDWSVGEREYPADSGKVRKLLLDLAA